MKKYILSILLVMTLTILLTGCGKDKGLIGSWEYEQGSGYIYTFNEDKTCSYEAFGTKMECTYEDDGKKVSILYTGNTLASSYEYKVEGDTLTIKDSFGKDVIYKRK
jgi:uncharacterized lipoprotein YehR (DUF1307 family)